MFSENVRPPEDDQPGSCSQVLLSGWLPLTQFFARAPRPCWERGRKTVRFRVRAGNALQRAGQFFGAGQSAARIAGALLIFPSASGGGRPMIASLKRTQFPLGAGG